MNAIARSACIALALTAVTGTRHSSAAEPSGRFTIPVFEDDFSATPDGHAPLNWTELQTLMHRQGEVRDGTYRILTRGNTHCPLPLDLSDFATEFDVRAHPGAPVTLLFIDFRIQPDPENIYGGYRLLYRWGEPDHFRRRFESNPTLHALADTHVPKTARLDLVDLRHRQNIEPILNRHRIDFGSPGSFDPTIDRVEADELTDFPDPAQTARIRVEVEGQRFRLWHDGVFQGELSDPSGRYDRAGMLGFDIIGSGPSWPGPTTLDNVVVFAAEPLPVKPVHAIRNIRIPEKYNRIHGGPMLYDVRVDRVGRAWRLSASARGGAFNPTVPHIMINPYVRLASADGSNEARLDLFRGTVGGQDLRRLPQSAPFGPAQHGGPLAAEMYFDFDPSEAHIAVGYEHYTIHPRYQDGACEVVVAPDGAVLAEGPPLAGGVSLRIESPAVKAVLERVAADNPFRDGFTAFLTDNHFFLDGEPIRFRAEVLRTDAAPNARDTIDVQVLDAFRETLPVQRVQALHAATDADATRRRRHGIHTGQTEWFDIDPLPPGVYHLAVTARDHQGRVMDVLRKAFSVLPDPPEAGPTAAERSGLPNLFGCAPWPFHPAYQADTYHYASTSTEWQHRPRAAEIHTALGKRVILNTPDLSTPEGRAVVASVRPHLWGIGHPVLPESLPHLNSLRIYLKGGRYVRQFVTEFLDSPFFRPVPEHPLAVTSTDMATLDEAAYTELHDTIKARYWKDFTAFVVDRKRRTVEEARAWWNEIFPGLHVHNYAYPLPVNQDYMTPYSAINSAGIDLKHAGWFREVLLVEAYWDECRYPSDRDWACWAILKMLQPDALFYWDNEGYVTAFGDSNNAVGWPPWGAMNVGPGFFGRGVVSYQYGPLYYRDGQVLSAYDHAMRLGYFPPDQIDEIWDAFRLYRQHTPRRWHPTVAYLYAQDWSALAPERLDPLGYPHNTADESIIFAYEEANRASTLNGFFLEPEHLSELTPDQIDTLVLPPLTHAGTETLSTIRALHAQGVHLVAFEAVPGIEDLFGVQPTAPSPDVVTITPADGKLRPHWLHDIHQARVRHSGDVRQVSYALTDGHALLVGRDADDRVIAPVLVRRDGPTARALLWTLPPTDIARSRNHTGHRLRGECMSELIRAAMGRSLQDMTTTPVKSSAGHLVSFYDAEDRLVVIVYENAFPFASQLLHPLVTIDIPGIGTKTITANRAVREGLREPDRRTFSFDLDENDVAVFVFEP